MLDYVYTFILPMNEILLLYMYIHIGVCPPLQDPVNGRVFVQGNIAFIVCSDGTVVMGNSILTCSNGNWNHPPPTCKLLNP